MPEAYEIMRDAFERKGMGEKAAKSKAAKLYNAHRKLGQPPITRYREALAGSAYRNKATQ
jgi:hypothetical protein